MWTIRLNQRKNEEKKIKETGYLRYIYELDIVCFQHDIAYGDFKNLPRRTAADKVLRNKAFNIAKNPNYDEYGYASKVDKFFH